MFGLGRKKDKDAKGTAESRRDGEEPSRRSLFGRLKAGLARTRKGLFGGLGDLLRGGRIDDEVLEEIEMHLLGADVGVEATRAIIEDLTARLGRRELRDSEALFAALREDMLKILEPVSHPLELDRPQGQRPFVILMVGVNGVGKTTTIGKLARRFQEQGRSVMLAAGDTFRAAAVEQLCAWGERNGVPVVAQARASDPASVIFDAMQSARARGVDVLIADTAGRLHTQSNLMEELKKIKRVMAKVDDSAPHEVMLVVDAGTGQNALAQARQFNEAVGLTGITLTKLDGTAKGGVVFAIARSTGIPIRFIGVGEQIDDLRVFDAREFVDALFEGRDGQA
ncbi:MAG TPA: signal recognition particle-docking protein FtsY [Gammaproteobacteria bacterium]|nr:signal recognition particle-docking protein FtsY [Gammaproteobacteria bacterium]